MRAKRYYVYVFNGWGQGCWGSSLLSLRRAHIAALKTWREEFKGLRPTYKVEIEPGQTFPPPVIKP